MQKNGEKENKGEMNMEENKYEAKSKEIREKYADVINEIAVARGVDLGVAFEMLKAIARGGEYGEGIELDVEELKKDYAELEEISKEKHIEIPEN